jgi:hypothetical protein
MSAYCPIGASPSQALVATYNDGWCAVTSAMGRTECASQNVQL